jgi:hypothetical protein
MCLFIPSAAFIHAMENTKTFLAPEGDELFTLEEVRFTATLKKEQLITATQEHWKVGYFARETDPDCTDPFQHCFICAETQREKMTNGEFS